MGRRPFTRESISRVREGPSVYKLYAKHARKPTYVGSSEDLRSRLLQHKAVHRYSPSTSVIPVQLVRPDDLNSER